MKAGFMKKLLVMTIFSGLTGALAGCGGGGPESAPVAVAATSSADCISCHATNGKSVSPTSGVKITEQWQLSAHNTAHGAGCLDCHSYAHYHDNAISCKDCHANAHADHGNSCTTCHGGTSAYLADCTSCHTSVHKAATSCSHCHGGDVPVDVALKNPDRASKCYGCHAGGASFKHPAIAASHFNTYTAATHPAEYASSKFRSACTACHEPHNPLLGQGREERAAWAESRHGEVKGEAWAHYDFKVRNDCNRCHSATGFLQYVGSDFITLAAWGNAADRTKEVLACNACHASSNFADSVREIGQVTVRYGIPTNAADATAAVKSIVFPDAGRSNLCIVCHVGRENNYTINAVTNFANSGFKNPHYLAGAGLMYMEIGFTGFVPGDTAIGATTYAKSLTIDNVSDPLNGISGGVGSTHRRLGTKQIIGDHGITADKVKLTTGGPCVVCHMTGGHSLKINATAYTTVCKNCHTSEAGVALTADNFQTIFLEPQYEIFNNAVTLAKWILQTKYGIKFVQSTNPYFFEVSTGKSVTDWTRGTNDREFGRRMMGAAHNINLLTRDKGAYAHARTYSRRLIYDTIDFLDDGVNNLSVGDTALASGLTDSHGHLIYTKGDKAFSDNGIVTNGNYGLGSLYTGTSESMTYLIAWNRGKPTREATGAWATPERP